jgi:hypothetical protein
MGTTWAYKRRVFLMIEFNDGNGNWIMKLEKGKISFNRQYWPEADPEDFAKIVIELLEKAHVKMENWEGIKKENVSK